MHIVDAARTAAALPFPALIEALRARFAAGAEVPQRLVLQPDAGMTSLVMPAWADGYYAVKIVNIAPGNAARGLAGLHSTVLLHEAATGRPLALMDGDTLTARRTAAASALAASYLARADAQHLLVLGAGRVAELLPAAHAAVRPITRVSVWARREAAAQALAATVAAQGFEARALSAERGGEAALAQAAAEAHIISTATLATEPVLRGAWLAPGSHLDLIGSFTPAMREADDEAFRHATIVVDTDEALVKSGELLGPMARGVFSREGVHATLAQLCRGERAGRGGAGERTVFKSVGTALEDLAAGMLAYAALAPRAEAPTGA